MDESTIEIEGSSENEAMQRACDALNTRIENLGYEIVSESGGKKGRLPLMGLMGGKKKSVKIRAWRKDERGEAALTEAAERAKEIVEKITSAICGEYSIQAIEKPDEVVFSIEGDEGGLLIGKNGNTLNALQYLTRKMVGNEFSEFDKKIVVDTEGYRERRRENVMALAKKVAKKVRDTRRRETLRPMNAYERRIVHMVLKDERGVETKSQGEGIDRCIVIMPSDKNGGGRQRGGKRGGRRSDRRHNGNHNS